MANALELMRDSAFLKLLGAEFVGPADGPPAVRVTIREDLLQSLGVAHGGVVGTLVDAAIGAAVAHAISSDRPNVATLEFKVNFHQPARLGDVLTATAELLHHGRQTFVGSARVTNQRGLLVGSGTATYVRLPKR